MRQRASLSTAWYCLVFSCESQSSCDSQASKATSGNTAVKVWGRVSRQFVGAIPAGKRIVTFLSCERQLSVTSSSQDKPRDDYAHPTPASKGSGIFTATTVP